MVSSAQQIQSPSGIAQAKQPDLALAKAIGRLHLITVDNKTLFDQLKGAFIYNNKQLSENEIKKVSEGIKNFRTSPDDGRIYISKADFENILNGDKSIKTVVEKIGGINVNTEKVSFIIKSVNVEDYIARNQQNVQAA